MTDKDRIGPLRRDKGPPGTYKGPPGTYKGPPGTYKVPPGTYKGPAGTVIVCCTTIGDATVMRKFRRLHSTPALTDDNDSDVESDDEA
jgi:hypothetical protein